MANGLPNPQPQKPQILHAPIGPAQAVTILLAAYQKIAAELHAIEISQEKLLASILGIYSAGATVLVGFVKDEPLAQGLRVAFTVIAALVLWYGLSQSRARNSARKATRILIVRVEAALAFYEKNAYLRDDKRLYPQVYFNYPHINTFLNRSNRILVIAAIAFVGIVWLAAPIGSKLQGIHL